MGEAGWGWVELGACTGSGDFSHRAILGGRDVAAGRWDPKAARGRCGHAASCLSAFPTVLPPQPSPAQPGLCASQHPSPGPPGPHRGGLAGPPAEGGTWLRSTALQFAHLPFLCPKPSGSEPWNLCAAFPDPSTCLVRASCSPSHSPLPLLSGCGSAAGSGLVLFLPLWRSRSPMPWTICLRCPRPSPGHPQAPWGF